MMDSFILALRRAQKGLGLALLDVFMVALLWFLVTYTFARIVYGVDYPIYLLVPWWVFVVGCVEVAALWQSFGVSIGHRILGIHLAGERRSAPKPFQRVIYFLGWHVSVLPLIGLFAKPAVHERLSGLSLQPSVSGGATSRSRWTSSVFWYMAALGATAIVGAVAVTVSMEALRRLLTDAYRVAPIWRALFAPSVQVMGDAMSDLVVTVFMAIMATAFAVVVAVPLSFSAARNLMKGAFGRIVYTLIRGLMSIMRSIEPIIWAIVFLVWVTSRRASFAGVLALWVHSIADLTKLYAERLESINEGVLEAVNAAGGSPLQVIRFGVIPQIVNPYISFTLYRLDINVRMATVVGLIGAGGIGGRLVDHLMAEQYQAAGTAMLMIVILVWAIDYLSARLRAKLA